MEAFGAAHSVNKTSKTPENNIVIIIIDVLAAPAGLCLQARKPLSFALHKP